MQIELGLPIGPWGITVDSQGTPWVRFVNVVRARRLPDGSSVVVLHNRERLIVPEGWNITVNGKTSEYAF